MSRVAFISLTPHHLQSGVRKVRKTHSSPHLPMGCGVCGEGDFRGGETCLLLTCIFRQVGRWIYQNLCHRRGLS